MAMDKQSQPLVTVCVANFNGATLLPSGSSLIEECIDSVLGQQLDQGVEILVYDDASEDRSRDIIKQRYSSTVTLIEGTQNVGYCSANNIMASQASGKYLLLLNNDAALRPGALEAFAKQAAKDPEAILSLEQYQSSTLELIDAGMGLDILAVPYPLKDHNPEKLVTVIGACLWVEQAYFCSSGGFPPWLESIGEDLFLCLSARSVGRSVSIAQGSSYLHHSGFSFGGGKADQTGTTSFRRRFLSERNRLSILLIFFPAVSIAPLTLAFLLSWVAEAILLSLVHQSFKPVTKIYYPAMRELIKLAPKIYRQRQLSRAENVQSARDFFARLTFMPAKLRFLLTHGLPRLSG
ncbi:glycosyltransferase family 2 protein [Congregibacter litoralis]|uniref:Putative glycosyltransferase n=1 Tax=Congregibacter litoralis KT71 TaxID=314285 RepID=A4A6D2_9GAMM|nr:glycosyltransferase [Congregibacter litoralis]EAQ98579.2 putative glycosyltransferase [Congregibacter litoralis KT71]